MDSSSYAGKYEAKHDGGSENCGVYHHETRNPTPGRLGNRGRSDGSACHTGAGQVSLSLSFALNLTHSAASRGLTGSTCGRSSAVASISLAFASCPALSLSLSGSASHVHSRSRPHGARPLAM